MNSLGKYEENETFYNQQFKSYPFGEKSNLESEFANQDPNPETSSFY
jgi:hypothetical protein